MPNIGMSYELLKAAALGDFEEVERLLSEDVDIDYQDAQGNTALHYASNNGHSKIVELLLEKKANIELENIFKKTPLFCAVECGHLEIVNLLLSKNANVNHRNGLGQTVLDIAREKNDIELEKILKNKINFGLENDISENVSDKTTLGEMSEFVNVGNEMVNSIPTSNGMFFSESNSKASKALSSYYEFRNEPFKLINSVIRDINKLLNENNGNSSIDENFSSSSEKEILILKGKIQNIILTIEGELKSYKKIFDPSYLRQRAVDFGLEKNFFDKLEIVTNCSNFFKYRMDEPNLNNRMGNFKRIFEYLNMYLNIQALQEKLDSSIRFEAQEIQKLLTTLLLQKKFLDFAHFVCIKKDKGPLLFSLSAQQLEILAKELFLGEGRLEKRGNVFEDVNADKIRKLYEVYLSVQEMSFEEREARVLQKISNETLKNNPM